MHHISICFLLVNCIITIICGKQIIVECPSYCECDLYFDLRRAACVNKRIVAINLDLPPQVEVLDITYNQISQLGDYAFAKNELLQLQVLNISHNKLSEINVYAFDNLTKLKILDMSYNILHYALSYWFSSLIQLEELYLQGNYFEDISQLQKYVFSSKTLKVLNLSKCYINHLATDIFNLPSLEVLDLSENQLLSLSQKVIAPLKNLKTLNIENNTISCNRIMTALSRLVNRRRIKYSDPCNKVKKFENIMMRTITTRKPLEQNSWIINDTEVLLKNVSTNNVPCEITNDKITLINISEFPYALLIFSVLFYGILIGFICGCGVKTCRMKHQLRNYRKKQTVRRSRRIPLNRDEVSHLILQSDVLGRSTPVLLKK